MDPARWQRVRAILQEALELEASERAAFLNRACQDPEERREVESLLTNCDDDPAFLEGGAGGLAATLLRPRLSLAPGRVIGTYEIVRELGRGGMGVVYLAKDTKLGRQVALKVLPEEVAHDEPWRARLRREARAAAAVSHAGIAQVYSLEDDPGGFSYVVSEYVDGTTLREEIAKGPLPVRRALDTARQIAGALAAAHARGVTHRDLKPENVMRTRDGTIKVLDFGLAHLDQDAGEARLTRTGTLMGTPGYIAPEQLQGEDAGPSADVYALGLVLHEMLTGQHAFAGSNNSATVMMARILQGQPNALPAGLVRDHPGIDEVVRRCLARRPDERFISMAAVAVSLERLMQKGGAALALAGAASSSAAPTGTGWWQAHQAIVSALYIAMIGPAWLNRGAPLQAWAHTGIVLGVILAAAVASTLRLHLLFIARVQPAHLHVARRRARAWIRGADWMMAFALLAAAGGALVRDRVWFAALFFTVAASATIAAAFIEPATTEATFGAEGE
jgi:predicted Ser/Thr protein kinase